MPRTGAVRARAGGSRRYSDQGSEQPGAELLPKRSWRRRWPRATSPLSRYLDRLDLRPMRARRRHSRHRRRRSGEHRRDRVDRCDPRFRGVSGLRNIATRGCDLGEDQLSLTDPDSRAMHAATRVGVGRQHPDRGGRQAQTDRRAGRSTSKVSDLGLLAETAVAARRKPGRRSDRRGRRRGLRSRSRISRPARMPASCRMCPSPSADQR